MATQRSARPHSVTCVTHDEAVLHCLNALAWFAEHVGKSGANGAGGDAIQWPEGWVREEGRIVFHFSDPRRRNLFLGEATRLLSGKWMRTAVEDETPRG